MTRDVDAASCNPGRRRISYLQDVRGEYFLDFARLADELGAVMVEGLAYDPGIIRYRLAQSPRLNVSPAGAVRRVGEALADGGELLARVSDTSKTTARSLVS